MASKPIIHTIEVGYRVCWALLLSVTGVSHAVSEPLRSGTPVWLSGLDSGPMVSDQALVLAWLFWGAWAGYAGLMLVRHLQRWVWLGVGLLSVAVLAVTGPWTFALLFAGLHLLAFAPGWLPAKRTATPEVIFYDGHCGLCHRWVKFVIARDEQGKAFSFSPLQGESIKRLLEPAVREALPDSIAVLTANGKVLIRSAAVVHMVDKIGGRWRVVGWLMRLIPRPVRDTGYNMVARVRLHLFKRPEQRCPLMPAKLRGRFQN